MTFFALSIRFIRGVSSDLKRESSSSISTSTKLPALIPPVALAIADTVAVLKGSYALAIINKNEPQAIIWHECKKKSIKFAD